MVLASFGREMSEAALHTLCDCTPFGTEAFKVVHAVRQLGFPATGKHTLSIDELAAQVPQGALPHGIWVSYGGGEAQVPALHFTHTQDHRHLPRIGKVLLRVVIDCPRCLEAGSA